MELPSAFSPNNDGQNDLLRVLGTGINEIDFSIYNRWGQLVFNTTNKDIGWDGSFNGDKQEVGVYVWRLQGSLTDGTQIKKSGNVTLVR
jgi:gliding motility-associated-like protein